MVKEHPLGTAPWNVGIYRFSESDSNYDLICRGSIISSKLVVLGKISEKTNL